MKKLDAISIAMLPRRFAKTVARARHRQDSSMPKVMVVYDDVPAGNHAIRVLARMFARAEDRASLRPELWRRDFLEDPEWLDLALVDAVAADIIVISASSPRALTASLASWIEWCLARKRGSRAAIVALFGSPEALDDPASPRLQFVQNAARKAGLDFFAPQPAPEPRRPSRQHGRAESSKAPAPPKKRARRGV